MDSQTAVVYDNLAETFTQKWRDQLVSEDLYALLHREFEADGATADIGCGVDHGVAQLDTNGYPAVGYDASATLLETAREQYPGLSFRQALLPELVDIAEGAFDNVFCEAVIMHLPPGQIGTAVQRLVSSLRPGGALYLSWCVTPDADQCDGRGRLSMSFDATPVRKALAGTEAVFDEVAVSQSPGRTIHRIVTRTI